MINEYRKNIIKLAYDFVLACKAIDGVKRIAVVGSFISEKEKPKDIDMLVNITDEMDLTYLAKISRTLQGKSGGLTSGADVFLANLDNQYLGRTCIWKDCRPGIRMSCDAHNCGKRKYLHDDLSVIKLSSEIIEKPPLVLFPNLVCNSSVPKDIQKGLINKLYPSAI